MCISGILPICRTELNQFMSSKCGQGFIQISKPDRFNMFSVNCLMPRFLLIPRHLRSTNRACVGFLHQQFLFFFLPSFSSGTIMIITPSLFYMHNDTLLILKWIAERLTEYSHCSVIGINIVLIQLNTSYSPPCQKESINCSNSVSGNSRGCGKCSFSPHYRNHSSMGN